VLKEIILQGKPVGQVNVWWQRKEQATHALKLANLLKTLIMEKLYAEFELSSLSQEILDKYEEINLLYDLSEDLGAVFDLKRIYQITLRKALQALNAERASVLIMDEKKRYLFIGAAVGIDEKQITRIRIPVGEGISGYVIERGEPLLIEDWKQLPKGLTPRGRGYKTRSFLSVPMICSPIQVKGERIGVINVTDKRDGKPFTTGDLKLLWAIASTAAISIYNCRLVKNLKESERVKKELEIAATIQKSLWPSCAPQIPGVQIAGHCQTAANVGGDYFDYFLGNNGTLEILIGDVSGHNVGAALMMAINRSVLRSEIRKGQSVAQVLHSTNAILFEDLDRAGLFITLFYARYDPRSRLLTYSNAGHLPPFVYRARKDRFLTLDAEGMLLGIEPEVHFEEKSLSLTPGDIVTFYTDGIIEGVNRKKAAFGERRFRQLIRQNPHLSPKALLQKILQAHNRFSKGVQKSDDITLIVLKVEV